MPPRLTDIRPEIDSLLTHLRRRIRQYVLVEGIAWVVIVLGLVFWVTMGLNWLYFYASSLELPLWFRVLVQVGAVGLFAAVVVLWVLLRFLRRMRTRALALVLERRFPELDDRLITAVEVADSQTGRETELTHAMLRRTVDDVTQAVRTVDVSDVFASRPLWRAVTISIALVVSIVAFGLFNRALMASWFGAFVSLLDEYWDRDTRLVALVVPENAQPNDPPREFADFFYKHPKGGDLNLIVVVPEQDEQTGKIFKVPERVQLRYDLAGDKGGATVTMSRTGERQFSYTLADLLDDMTFTIRGGDFVNRVPYRVRIVDPPAVDHVVLHCRYPEYTGLNTDRDEQGRPFGPPRRVAGTQISLPMETEFTMVAATNKPLVGVRLECGQFRLRLADGRATLTLLREDGLPGRDLEFPAELAGRWLQAGAREFRVSFALRSDAAEQLDALRSRSEATDPDGARAPAAEGSPPPAAPARIPLVAETTLRIYLEDSDRIGTIEPSRLLVQGIVDKEPEADLAFKGIGEHITRKASIPVSGVLRDDYGIVKTHFAYTLGEKGQPLAPDLPWLPRDFARRPAGTVREFRIGGAEGGLERFSVASLDLEVGQTLKLTVFAEDGDTLNGPHSVYAVPRPEYTFKVVTDEELLSVLFQKELGLRSRFEQIISEVEGTRRELSDTQPHIDRLKQLKTSGGPAEQVQLVAGAIQTAADRSTIQVNKNALETKSVEVGFGEIVDELENNGLLTPNMAERLRDRIVKSLNEIAERRFQAVDRAVGAFRAVHEEGGDASAELGRSVEEIDLTLELMRQVLAEMEDLAKFHELQEELRKMISGQEDVRQRTQQTLEDLLKRLQDLPID
ncbi:MAG TPA: hypothetical protein VML55_08310 [Planctomycetaceae bacterium]|nr:hypothetical protein [Planctomycetaceae bacterium]